MNWIIIATGLIFLICIVTGLYKGAVRIAVSLAASIVTLILVFLLTPYISEGLSKFTPVDEFIESQIKQAVTGQAASDVQEEGSNEGLTVENVRRVLQAAGISEKKLNDMGITVEDIVNGSVTGAELAEHGISSGLLAGLLADDGSSAVVLEDVAEKQQTETIRKADIPSLFKSLLIDHNNSKTYNEVGASTFIQYLAGYGAKMIINIISFILTFVLISAVMRAVIFALDIIANLPVIATFNRLGGAALGAAEGLIIVWLLFIIITMLYTTSFGKETYDAIQGNTFLKLLYDLNPVLRIVLSLK